MRDINCRETWAEPKAVSFRFEGLHSKYGSTPMAFHGDIDGDSRLKSPGRWTDFDRDVAR